MTWTAKEIRQYISEVKRCAIYNPCGTNIIEVHFPRRHKIRWEKRTYDLAKSHLQALKLIEQQEKLIDSYQHFLDVAKDPNITVEEKADKLRSLIKGE